MSRSRNSRKGSGSHPRHSCYLCTKRPPEERLRRNALAPSVAEQLDEMCSCPACRGGYEDLCGWECAACGDYGCDGLGAVAFCEVA